jgi:hypothetical protein
MKVYMAKQLMNNRVTIDANFGRVNASESQATTLNTSQWVGDMNVEYKVTDDGRVRLRAFNRSNDNTLMNASSAPYTQGVGISYREEFETGRELAKRYRDYITRPNPNREKKKEQQQQQPLQPPAEPPRQAPVDSTRSAPVIQ